MKNALHKIIKISVLFLFANLPANTFGQEPMPKEAQQLINRLPNKQLTLDLVLAKAYLSSDSANAVKAKSLAIEADHLQSQVLTSSQLYATTARSENNNDESAIFEARETQTDTIGVNKRFKTGTKLGLEYTNYQSTLAPGNTFQAANKTSAKILFEQSLWRDFFGYLTRQQISSGKKSTDAQKAFVQMQTEDWVMGMIKVYYGAILARSQLSAAQTSYERRMRLVKITRLKLNRGTAERPDFLKVESALLEAESKRNVARHDLQTMWRELVTNLKLPASWSEVPAEHIPILFDKPIERARDLCKSKKKSQADVEKSSVTQYWQSRYESSLHGLKAAENNFSPDLSLFGDYGGHGIVGSHSTRIDKSMNNSSPVWTVGLKFSMPLEWYDEKARLKRESALYAETAATYEKVKSDQINNWVSHCSYLEILAANVLNNEKSVDNYTTRTTLEEKRFQLGRTSTQEVILAGDDLSIAELQLSQTRSQLNETAWAIIKLNGELETHLQNVVTQYAPFKLIE